MKVRVVIVEDEPRAHKILEAYIKRIPELELIGKFLDAPSALAFLKGTRADVILLDVTMPEINGFELLKQMTEQPYVIFTTAHPEFALESYEYNALDYLKKPIPFLRFNKAIQKLFDHMKNQILPEAFVRDINLKVEGENITIPLDQIRYFQSLGNYIKIFMEQKMFLSQITTKEIEDALPKQCFLRIHKSYIVNKSKITSFAEETISIGNIKLPIGKTFKKYVKDALPNFSVSLQANDEG